MCLLVSVFLTGGIVGYLLAEERKLSLSSFFADCGKWFWRFFRLTLYNIIVQLLVAAIVYVPMALILIGRFKGGANEPHLFYPVLLFILLHLLIAIYFLVIADYSRFMIVTTGSKKVLKQYWAALKFVSRRFFATYGLYLLLLSVPVITVYLYFKISGVMHVTSVLLILLMLLIQQLFIWLRSGYRVWIFASQVEYYRSHFLPSHIKAPL